MIIVHSLLHCKAGFSCINVVVNFLCQVVFVFLLFLGMLLYANEVEAKEKKKLPEIKN